MSFLPDVILSLACPHSPFAKQHHIVAKAGAPMALPGTLDASFAATAARLLDTLLAAAPDPTKANEMEAAQ